VSQWPPSFPPRPVILQAIPLSCHGLAQIVVLRQYQGGNHFKFSGHIAAEQKFRQMPAGARSTYDLFWGRMHYGLQRELPGRVPFLTMLRDPVERIIAHYHFVLSAPMHYLHRRVAEAGLSLHDYVSGQTTVELDNEHVRCLNPVPRGQIHFGQVTRAMLDVAKLALEHPDTIFGFAEHFDETLLLFARAMGWPDVRYLGAGMRSEARQATTLEPETLDLIRETSALDIELYEFARAIFEERLARLGPRFQAELRGYQRQNEALANHPGWSNQVGEVTPPAVQVPAAASEGVGTAAALDRDIYWLASYPRSGNSWLRFLLDSYFFPPARYMQEVGRLSGELDWWLAEARRLGHGEAWIPGALERGQAKYIRPEGFPAHLFFKTHFAYSENHPLFERTRGAVYLLRNPRDVLLSGMNFSHLTDDGHGVTTDRQYALSFIEHGGDPAWIGASYGTWAGNARSWLGTNGAGPASAGVGAPCPVLLVRYEELKSETEAQLGRILDFLEVPVDRHRVRCAIECCSLRRLRNLEVGSRALTDITTLKRKGRFFFNEGRSDQSLMPLGADVEEAFEAAFGHEAKALGYGHSEGGAALP
jgi:hypothetical protein